MSNVYKTSDSGLAIIERYESTGTALNQAEHTVYKYCMIPLNQGQFDALVSLALSIGIYSIQDSTVVKQLNRGNHKAAADEFMRYICKDGMVDGGLLSRRQAERELFLSGGLQFFN